MGTKLRYGGSTGNPLKAAKYSNSADGIKYRRLKGIAKPRKWEVELGTTKTRSKKKAGKGDRKIEARKTGGELQIASRGEQAWFKVKGEPRERGQY